MTDLYILILSVLKENKELEEEDLALTLAEAVREAIYQEFLKEWGDAKK